MVGSHFDDFDWGDFVAILHPCCSIRCFIISWSSVFSGTDSTLTLSYNIQSQALTHRHTYRPADRFIILRTDTLQKDFFDPSCTEGVRILHSRKTLSVTKRRNTHTLHTLNKVTLLGEMISARWFATRNHLIGRPWKQFGKGQELAKKEKRRKILGRWLDEPSVYYI